MNQRTIARKIAKTQSALDNLPKTCRQCKRTLQVKDFPQTNSPCCFKCRHGEGYGR